MEMKKRSFREKAKEHIGHTLSRLRSKTPDSELPPGSRTFRDDSADAGGGGYFSFSDRVWSTTSSTHNRTYASSNTEESLDTRVVQRSRPQSDGARLTEQWEIVESVHVQDKKDYISNLAAGRIVDQGESLNMKETSKTQQKRKSRHAKPVGTLEYQVADRDTLQSIAANFDTTPSELKKLNRLMSDVIFPGQEFYIPDKNYIPPQSPKPDSPPNSAPPGASLAKLDSPPNSAPPTMGVAAHLPSLSRAGEVVQQASSQLPSSGKLLRQLERLPLRGPGYAQRSSRSSSSTEPVSREATSHPAVVHAPITAEEAKRMDEECMERFIKVNVKHITDGQGVVSGVLLVTPNAVMFDPNVSDPLVKEHGEEKYGMIAPMEMIISAAMYHDIAAMKVKGQDNSKTESQVHPPVYHAANCPLHHKTQSTDVSHGVTTDRNTARATDGDQPSLSPSSSSSHQVPCDEDNKSDEGGDDVFASDDLTVEGEQPQQAHDQNTQVEDEKVKQQSEKSVQLEESNVKTHGARSVKKQDNMSDRRQDSECSCGAVGGNASQDTNSNTSTATLAPNRQQNQMPPSSLSSSPTGQKQSSNSDDKDLLCHATASESACAVTNVASAGLACDANAGNNAIPSSFQQTIEQDVSDVQNVHMKCDTQTQNSQPLKTARDQSAESTDNSSPANLTPHKKPDLLADIASHQDLPAARGSHSSIHNDSGSGDGAKSSAAVSTGTGLITRTLGSISSLGGSFPSSPKMTQFVDFSSGLFSRSGADSQDSDGCGKTADDTVGLHCQIGGIDVAIRNAVKLDDKPELFKSLDDLIPKPTEQYTNPPLYLCLKLGMPVNKQVPQHCAIESYMKNKKKPEYWFSIPRDRVDHLYAFFIQWSPEIYGDDGTDTDSGAKEKGFVPLSDYEDDDDDNEFPGNSDQAESLDLVHDHFTNSSHKKLVRQMTKDWEVINMEELKRRQSVLEDEMMPLPELTESSNIVGQDQIKKLAKSLPPRSESTPWTLQYSSEKHGMSLKTLYRTVSGVDSPTMVIIKDTSDQVFGCFLSCAPKISDHFYGTGESYLFTFYPEFKKFFWTGENNCIAIGTSESLSFGSGEGHSGIWLDAALYHGHTQQCQTFNNSALTESEDFVVRALEVWAFI